MVQKSKGGFHGSKPRKRVKQPKPKTPDRYRRGPEYQNPFAGFASILGLLGLRR